jgi:fatty-acyl-CoA synthase
LAAGPDDVLVGWVPPWHDLGLLRFVLAPVHFGAPCYLVEPAIRTLPEWLGTASRVRATILGAPDFAYRLASRLVDPDGLDLSNLRVATNGGEPVRLGTIAAFESRFGVPGVVRPGYGLAEATLGVAGVRPGEPLRVDGRGNVSCGRPVPGVEVQIEGQIRPGDAGEILVRGATVFEGYFEAPEATREVLRAGWLRTGDTGALDADGQLTVLGRTRSMLKRGGDTLAPRELEEAAESATGVRVAAAVGVPPGPRETTERTVLAIEAERAAEPAAAAAAAAAAVRTALGFSPDRVLVLAARALPRTANGKIRHRELCDGIVDGSLERAGAVVFSSGAGP